MTYRRRTNQKAIDSACGRNHRASFQYRRHDIEGHDPRHVPRHVHFGKIHETGFLGNFLDIDIVFGSHVGTSGLRYPHSRRLGSFLASVQGHPLVLVRVDIVCYANDGWHREHHHVLAEDEPKWRCTSLVFL